METAIEDSLDILDERYKTISEISQKPVFFDSVEIRQVIAEIKTAQNAVLKVAQILTSDPGLKSETKEKNSNEKQV